MDRETQNNFTSMGLQIYLRAWKTLDFLLVSDGGKNQDVNWG